MPDTKWAKPVIVNSPFLGEVAVTDSFHALTILMDYWPVMSGPYFTKARIACSAALQGRVTSEEARAVFQLAAEEAGALLQGMRGFTTKDAVAASRTR